MLLKNKNIIFNIRRSKVTDYAALTHVGKIKGYPDLVCEKGLEIYRRFTQTKVPTRQKLTLSSIYVIHKITTGICNVVWDECALYEMGLVATKSVFGVSDKVKFKPASSATETS